MRRETEISHAGICTDDRTGAISTPIYQTATFRHPALGVSTGYDYTRTSNPTREALETTVAGLEQGAHGYAFSSGMAAITAVLMLFKPGDRLLVSEDLYGGTYRIFQKVFSQYGLIPLYADTSNPKELDKATREDLKAVFIETPTNPLMKITDLRVMQQICTQRNILIIVDNTFMTPWLQRPLELGADIVIHSGTKYLNGHNDVLCGFVVAKRPDLCDRIGFLQNATGGILSPMDSWLVLRGIKTLALRMGKSEENARKIARKLAMTDGIQAVYYPGLPSHPGRDIHASQADGFGSMISFRVKNAAKAKRIIERVRVLSFAESLGGVESLITYPARQTHGDIPEEIRQRIGITDDLLRLSIGIEDADDLIEDLEQAMR